MKKQRKLWGYYQRRKMVVPLNNTYMKKDLREKREKEGLGPARRD